MQVDHIIPPSKFSHKTYKRGQLIKDTSLKAKLLNSHFDLVPACPSCNRTKGDQMTPGYIAKGFGSKTLQKGVFTATNAVAAGILLGAYGVNKGARLAGKVVTMPLKEDVAPTLKFLYVGLIVLLVLTLVVVKVLMG